MYMYKSCIYIIMQTKYPHSSLLATPSNVAPAGGQLGGGGKAGKNKRTASALRLQDASSVMGDGVGGADGETGGEGAEVPKEAQVYVDAKTYVYLEIELHRALIPKRPADILAERCGHSSLVPRPYPAFQCCTLKNVQHWKHGSG